MTWLSYVVRNLRRWLAAYGHRHPVTEGFAMCVAPAGADWFGDAISPGSRPGLIIYRASGAI